MKGFGKIFLCNRTPDTYLEGRIVRECGVEEVPDGEVDLGLKQIVLKDYEAGVRWSQRPVRGNWGDAEKKAHP